MNRAVLAVATERGVNVFKPGAEATGYTLASSGLVGYNCLCLCQAGNGHLTAGTQSYFVQTSPDGQAWTPAMEGLDRPFITALARHPARPDLMAAGTCPPCVAVSRDHGRSWTKLSPLEALESATRWTYPEPPYRAKVSSIAFHPEHESVMFCAIQVGGLVATNNFGETWTTRSSGLPPSIRTVALPGGTTVYVGTTTGFFRSEDLGGAWTECNAGLPYPRVDAMAVAQGNPNIILLGVSSAAPIRRGGTALALSQDGGRTWSVSSDGLPRLDDRYITSLTFGHGGFYAGTDKGDLFLLNNLEGRWTRVGANLPPIQDLLTLS